jgi:serine/threonine-protein kinase
MSIDEKALAGSGDAAATDPVGTPAATSAYLDEGLIDRGGMSAVHRVFDRVIGRRVAMKVMAPEFAAKSAEVERFFDEARVTGRLDHPNIPPVHAFGFEQGRPYFTMTLVDGRNLQELLQAPGYAPSSSGELFRVLQHFLRTCDALAFAHSRGVVHCDVKPRNIMVGRHGQVYLMDWGIARVLQDATKTVQYGLARAREGTPAGGIQGTVPYMSPEQAQGRTELIGPRTDVFGLGAVLYRMLAGRPLYVQGELPALLEQAKAGRIAPPWVVAPGLRPPRGLCDIAMKALAADPADRHSSVEELQREVEAFMRGEVSHPPQKIPAGQLLVKEGDVADAAYLIVEGRCQVFRTIDGQRQVLGELGPGALFGETAIFGRDTRSASVEAMTGLVVHTITRAHIDEELERTHWTPRLAQALAMRFREVSDRATRLGIAQERLELGLEVARWMALKAEGSPRAVPWTPLRLHLCRKFRRTGIETNALVSELEGYELDQNADQLILKA